MIGRQISHYRILEKLGEGGMGVVYKAEDTKLKRTVALKFLRSDILPSKQDKARFIYEARAASALEHNNICSIYEVDETKDGQMFICMPFYEGETLRAKIKRGPLQISEAIDVTLQVAEGLEEAHQKGIIHRDIKSGNIIVTPKGQVRIMDFGLAKADRSTKLTSTGVTLGTVTYMSPEQVRGERIDRRADIWSTGVVLYEMIAGRLPFHADHDQAIMYMILNQEPEPLTGLRTGVPMELERIADKAMAKLPDERYQSARELIADLHALQRKLESEKPSTPVAPGSAGSRQRLASRKGILTIAIALAAVVCVFIFVRVMGDRSIPPARPVQITNGAGLQITPAISPDGERIAYVSNEAGNMDIYVVGVQGGNPLNLTHSPSSDYNPEWFPDGSSIAFVSDRNGEDSIWKIGQFGGSAILLISNAYSPAISSDGKEIAFSRAGLRGELRIAVASLSDPSKVTVLTGDKDGQSDHCDPAWSPDGSKICYSARRNLWVVPSAGGKAWPLTTDEELDCEPVWSPNGKHVYFSSYREGTLALWRVSAKGGKSQRVTTGVGQDGGPSISSDGKRLTYYTMVTERDVLIRDLDSARETRLPGLSGGKMPAIAPDNSKIVFTSDRWGHKNDLWIQPLDSLASGASEPARLTDQPGNASHPAFSPDGKWIAYYRIIGKESDIWVVSCSGGQPVRFTRDPALDIHPTWSPDGSQLAFASNRGGNYNIWVAPVRDGECTGSPTQITRREMGAFAPSWSPDGELIAFVGAGPSGPEIWVIPSDGSSSPRQVTQGAGALRVRWEPSGKSLLVSGKWGQKWFVLRRVSLGGGRAEETVPPILLGSEATPGVFDVSRDGRLLVYCKEDVRGNIWLLEAERGSY